jgi:hypothetical protein
MGFSLTIETIGVFLSFNKLSALKYRNTITANSKKA